MKRLEISRLMDDYVDNEFCPEEGSAASAAAVKAQVLAQASPAKKRRMPRWKTALIAAALAVGAVLCIAAGLPDRIFQLASGGKALYRPADGLHIESFNGVGPIAAEEGRLWLTINGQHTDITDLIDEATPYIYDNTDPATGYRDYLIVGGTVEDYGWFECYEIEKGRFAGSGSNRHTIYCTIEGVTYDYGSLTEEQRERIDPDSFSEVLKPWFENAAKQLNELGVRVP